MKFVTLRAKTAAGALAATAAALLATATPAHAATFKVTDNCDVPWINCTEGDLWMLYSSKANAVKDGKYVTSWASFYGNVSDYYGTSQYQGSTLNTYRYVFNGNGSGAGQYVKNNTASVQNCSEADNYRVYYNSGYSGHSQYFKHREAFGDCALINLDSTLKNNNASEHFA
ncbi:hypothetical protein OOK36_49600 [Streptomyces sp. NBC_00365]|uniref:hypothetical protein n=1 Tax=Streptomyces sp. NBC_00365 TaxID=2975726 RepID=UPI00225005F4|nr:hypothetical protein [Streptomyces sp. NBC_00365]MCX5096638.1 hypothetical protein [Streptomyces sp. NBC_00365]